MVTVGFEVATRFWHDLPVGGGPLAKVITNGPDTSSSSVPSSQTLVNATQTGGDCGTLWTALQSSDDIRCSYREVLVGGAYALEVRFGWSGVPLTGDRWTLIVECQRLNPGAENVLVQVGQGGSSPSSWRTAYTCNSDTDQTFNTYKLSAVELNSGAPVTR